MADRESVIKALNCCACNYDALKTCFIKYPEKECPYVDLSGEYEDARYDCTTALARDALELLKEQEPDQSKYEHHIDHTDCVWYKPEEGNECPVTCSQYRDGWNDAMDYIFKDGRGYRPYVRG